MAVAPGLISGIRSRRRRLDAPQRLAGVDLARGLAVCGMLAAHLLVIEPFDPADAATWMDVVNGRSSILFATLAGVSIALVTGGPVPLVAEARVRASARLALRAAMLWVLGILLAITGVPVHVILPAYALLFLLALPFLGMRARALFLVAAALAVTMPWVQALLDASPLWVTPLGEQLALVLGWSYPFPVWIVFLLAGMGVGRLDLRRVAPAAVLVAVGGALAALAYGLHAGSGSDSAAELASVPAAVWTARAHSSGLLEVVGSGGFALLAIGLCLLVCRPAPMRELTLPLRAVGAMPLTAYTAQLVVWAIIAASVLGDTGDLRGFQSLDPFWPMTVGIILAATGWALVLGRGPLEAGLDRFARWVVPPVAEGTPPAARIKWTNERGEGPRHQ